MRRIRNILIVAVFMHCLFIQNSFIYAEIIAGFDGTIFKKDIKAHSFYIDKCDEAYVSIFFSGGESEIVLYNPQNKKIDPMIAEKDSDIEYKKLEPNELAVKGAYYIIKNPLPGEWKIEVSCLESPKEGVHYGIEVSAEGGFIVDVKGLVPKSVSCNVGEELLVSARLGTTAHIKSIEIVADIEKLGKEEIVKTVSLYDDGSHFDGQEGDGVYANKFKVNLLPSSHYAIILSARGITKDNNQFSRAVFSTSYLEVMPISPVHVIGVVSEETKDTEGDGFIDQIIINVKIKSEVKSSVMLQGHLFDAKNKVIDSYIKGHLYDTFMLDKGICDIPFIFETGRYFEHESEGPFKFTTSILLKILDEEGNLEFFSGAVLDKDYFTKAYKYTDFQHPYVYFTGKFNDKGLDMDGDNKYDILRFSAEVSLTFDGDYLVGATLKDKDGKDIYYATNKVNLEKGIQTVSLDFDGKEIVKKESDGPYRINNFLIYKYIGTPKDKAVFFGREIASSSRYTTEKYNSDDFRK